MKVLLVELAKERRADPRELPTATDHHQCNELHCQHVRSIGLNLSRTRSLMLQTSMLKADKERVFTQGET